MISRNTRPFVALLAASAFLGSARGDDNVEKDFVALFNGKDLTGFKTVLFGHRKKNETTRTFVVKNGVIEVSGKPYGYLYTEKSFKNYVLRFRWKFLQDGGTGTLLYITGALDARNWPNCVEIQGGPQALYGSMGRFTDEEARKKAIKFYDWNITEIISRNGDLTFSINGIPVTKVKFQKRIEGRIGWQSEGAVFQLKDIRIKDDD